MAATTGRCSKSRVQVVARDGGQLDLLVEDDLGDRTAQIAWGRGQVDHDHEQLSPLSAA
jgi:hypothetical protein